MHKRRLPPDNLLPGIIIMLLVLLSLAVAGLVQFWDLAKATIGQAIGTLFAGCAAILGGLLAYRAAKLKVEQEERHRQEDLDARMVARHLQVRRVCNNLLERMLYYHGQFRRDATKSQFLVEVDEFVQIWNTDDVQELLKNGSEIDPEILSLLFDLISNLKRGGLTHNLIKAKKVTIVDPVQIDGKWKTFMLYQMDQILCNIRQQATTAALRANDKVGRDYLSCYQDHLARAQSSAGEHVQKYFTPLPLAEDAQTTPPAAKP